jgi:hypothetical protein
VEHIRSNGRIEIEGLLSADHIDLNIGFHSSAKEIGGEKITVKGRNSINQIKQLINFFTHRTDILEAEILKVMNQFRGNKSKVSTGKKYYNR